MSRLAGWMRVALVDLRGDLRRFGVLLACLALGTAAIAAVGSVGAALDQAVVRDATTLLGGDLEAYRPDRPANDLDLARIARAGKFTYVADNTARGHAGQASTLLDIVAAAEDYPLLGTVRSPQLAEGEKPAALIAERDGVHGALVAPDLFEKLSIGMGDRFNIGQTQFEIRGVLEAIPDGAVRGFRLGVTILIPAAALATMSDVRPPLPGVLTQHRYKIVVEGMTTEEAFALLAEELRDPRWTVRSPREAAGSLARYYDLFSRFLLIVGLSSLLVGGVGVSTGVTAYIGERQRSIATMRSLGATGARVLVHFLTQVAALATVGVGIGVLLGAISSAVALPFVGRALAANLPPMIDAPALLTAAGFGYLAAFAFSYLPLVRAQSVSPALLFRSAGAMPPLSWRQATRMSTLLPIAAAGAAVYMLALVTTRDVQLVSAFAIGAVLAFLLLRGAAALLQVALRHLPPPPGPGLRYAVRQIRRPGSSAPIVVLSLGLGLAMLLVISLLNSNLSYQLLGVVGRDAPTYMASELFPDEIDILNELAATDPDVAWVESSPSIRTRIVELAGTDARTLRDLSDEATFLLGVDIPVTWRRDQPRDGNIVEGEWWPEDYEGPPLISLRSALRGELGLRVGDVVVFDLFGDRFEARIANFRDYQWQQGLNFAVIFSPGDIQSYPRTFIGSVKAVEGREEPLGRTLVASFPDIAFIPIGEALAQAISVLGQLATAVNIVGSLAVVNGLFVLAGTMAAGRKQRETDAIIQKVLGATRGNVLWAFMLEYGFLGAFAALIATVIGITAAWAITQSALEIGFAADPVLILTVVLGAVALTVVAGAATTWRSLSARPAPFLREV